MCPPTCGRVSLSPWSGVMTNEFGRRWRRVCGGVCVCVLAFGFSASAQNVGMLSGIVKDPQGLAVPGASLTLLNRLSKATQSAVSDEHGRYTMANIAYGTYVLTVE